MTAATDIKGGVSCVEESSAMSLLLGLSMFIMSLGLVGGCL